MYRLMAMGSGVLVAVMVLVNGVLAKVIGNYGANVWIHLTGLMLVVFWMALQKKAFTFYKKKLPLWWYSGGALGFATVLLTNASFIEIGASLTIGIGLMGQSAIALIIDHLGLFGTPKLPIKRQQGLSLTVMALGILMMTLGS